MKRGLLKAGGGELGGDKVAENKIAALLRIACDHDQAAREARKECGRLLIEMRQSWGRGEYLHAIHAAGLDEATVTMLVEMHTGGREAK